MKVADLFAALGLEVDRAAFAAADNAIAAIASTTARATANVEHFSQVVLATMRAGQAPVNDAIVSWDGLNKKTERVPINLRNVAIGLTAVGFAAREVVGFFGSVVDEYSKLDKTGQRTGVDVESLQALGHAGAIAGVEFDKVTDSLGKFQKAGVDANNGSKEMRKAFRAVGVDTGALADGSLSTEDALLQVAEAFAGMEDGATKSALAQKLFSESGVAMIPLLNSGRAGLAAMTKEARDLGIVVGRDDVKAFADFDDEITRTKASWKAVKLEITRALLPAFQAIVGALSAIAKHIDIAITAIGSLVIAFAVLKAGSVAAAWASLKAWLVAMAPLVLMGLAIFALILLVEDLWTWFKGGDSVLRELYNAALEYLTWDKLWSGIRVGIAGVLAGLGAIGAEIADKLGLGTKFLIGEGGQAGVEDWTSKFIAPANQAGRAASLGYGVTGGLVGPAMPSTTTNNMQPTINITAPAGVSAQDIANLTRTALGEWYDEEARKLSAQTGGGL